METIGAALTSGAFWFGLVIGYITYRTLRRAKEASISDIATVIGAVGGAAVVALFPADSGRFDYYAFGLAIGFFVYLILAILFAGNDKVNVFLGD
jgi:NhaP-type Na+/H+ or K+/H+ antiporter